jgi:riboflavin synthase
LATGSFVNLERALRASDRLGGHFVQGHVDTTAVVAARRTEGDWEFLQFEIDPGWTALLVPKGSIAVNGVSLTLVEVKPASFSVMLIPHTLMLTNLGSLSVGDRVNIETDILAKHVRKLMGIAVEPEC